jgi:type I restriction enzyme S subunit
MDELGMSCVALRDVPGATFNGFTKRLRPKNTHKVVPEYAGYYFRSSNFRQAVTAMSSMSTRASLNNEMLGRLSMSLPSSEEQLAIGHILGTLDNKIELNRRMNETLEAMARALFKSWFVDFDPVRAKAKGLNPALPESLADLFPNSFENSELGAIPKGWRASVIGEEVKLSGGLIQTGPFGSQLHASDYAADGVPVVMPKDLMERRVSTLSIARVSVADAERLSRHRLQEGDIVYSRRGDVEKHGLIRSREAGWLCGTGCLLVRLGTQWPSPLFVSFALDLPETRAWIVRHAIGATMPNLNTGILAGVPFVVPPHEVLLAFNHVAQHLADRVVASDGEIETLVSLRAALLPKLISGELRIRDAERFVEATM